MLTGSTLGLRSLPVLPVSSQLPCRRLRSPALTVRGHFAALAALPRSIISSASFHLPSVLGEQNVPESRDALPTNGVHLSLHPIVSANGMPHLSRSATCMPVLPANKNRANLRVAVDSPSSTQDHPQHGDTSCTQRLHRALAQTKRKCPAQKRRTLLWILLADRNPDRVWAAYEELLSHRVMIPHHLLHRLTRLLASIKPRTRTVHLQLLSVLTTLERNHGQLRLWEWNTLIDSAGKQWHKTSLEDYENALDIFNRRRARPVGNTASVDETIDAEANLSVTQQTPDIWTYNILLSIATRSNSPLAVRHASSLLLASGLTPNRYTHLCLLRYFAVQNDLRNVCSTLGKMRQQGLEIGLDGINACLSAYGRNGRFDVALPIYRILRSSIKPTPNLEGHDLEEDYRYIRDIVGLDIPDGLEPDEITYTMMIQSLAYHGDLKNALGVFVDMLLTTDRKATTCTGDTTVEPACYKPSMAAFRGLFLGFSRHGREVEHHIAGSESVAMLFPSSRAIWDKNTLETVFAAFLQLPSQPKPTNRLIYWILVAFDKTSGNDSAKLREVWIKLEAKYGGGWGGRLEEIRRSIFPS